MRKPKGCVAFTLNFSDHDHPPAESLTGTHALSVFPETVFNYLIHLSMRHILTLLLFFFAVQVHAANYYWVGGGGNWSDLNHWRLGSVGGAIPSIVPSQSDNVFFTASSGFGATVPSRTVTLDANGFCRDMSWASVPNNPLFSTPNAAFTVEVWGNLSLSPTITYPSILRLKAPCRQQLLPTARF